VSETKLVSAILDALAAEPGVVAWRNSVGARGHRRFGLGVGSADIIACVDGRFLALEVKDAKGVQSDEQQRWGNSVWLHGGHYVIVRSVAAARKAVAWARQRVEWTRQPPRDPAANSATLSRSSEVKSRMVTRRR